MTKLKSDVEANILREQNRYLRVSILFEKEIKRQKRLEREVSCTVQPRNPELQ